MFVFNPSFVFFFLHPRREAGEDEEDGGSWSGLVRFVNLSLKKRRKENHLMKDGKYSILLELQQKEADLKVAKFPYQLS